MVIINLKVHDGSPQGKTIDVAVKNLKKHFSYFSTLFIMFNSKKLARIFQTSSEMEMGGLKETIVGLETSLVEKQNEILFLEEEVRSLRMKLTKRDADLMKQERELNKLRVSYIFQFSLKSLFFVISHIFVKT